VRVTPAKSVTALESDRGSIGIEAISRDQISRYLSEVLGDDAKVLSLTRLGKGVLGITYLIEAMVRGKKQKVVLKSANPSGFGQDYPSDRADTLLYAYSVYNRLPKHVRAFDVGAVTDHGALKRLGDTGEFFLLMEYMEGHEYAKDLDRIREQQKTQELDLERVRLLADYMAQIHSVRHDDPGLYLRRIRDLIGRGDCITGIVDSYPKDERTYAFTNDDELEQIEKKCIEWRWRIKDKASRLCQVHGDLHPFNILWQGPDKFTLLDRSRGEWGEAADDVSCLSINYVFWSLIGYGRFTEPFKTLFNTLFTRYLERTRDEELVGVIQPFFAFRSLVIANPLFYPAISSENRRRIFDFMRAVLESDVFDYRDVDSYLQS
jgi:aminoglycoside phosphotransferase (APT) family kinase protein